MAGDAPERNAPDHLGYADWSPRLSRELHKAGWLWPIILQQALTRHRRLQQRRSLGNSGFLKRERGGSTSPLLDVIGGEAAFISLASPDGAADPPDKNASELRDAFFVNKLAERLCFGLGFIFVALHSA